MKLKATRWTVSSKKADFYALAKRFDIDPVIARIIRNRDIIDEKDYESYLKPNINHMYSPSILKDMDKAAQVIIAYIKANKKIRIVGDYDTDGTCSTYILYKGLRELNARVDFYIPDRVIDGYGLNMDIVDGANEDDIELIVTCDNGIAAIDEIKYAESLGIEVIVTDHHQMMYIDDDNGNREYILPNAIATINPQRYDDLSPFKLICGGMVAFKLIKRIFELSNTDTAIIENELKYFAAIATVGDLMPLCNENRCLVKNALDTFVSCKNKGLIILCDRLGLDIENMSAYDIGFRLSPTINAGGRLSTAKLVLNLFIEENGLTAQNLSDELIKLNEKRKSMTEAQVKKATDLVLEMDNNEKVIVVFLDDCHESIAGIVASRIKDSFNRPTYVVTKSKNDMLKGSARSIGKYSMYEEMTKIKDIFTHYGGHRMAAGFSFHKDRLDEFRKRLNRNTTLTNEDFVEEVVLDLKLPLYYLNIAFINQLKVLEPFGMGNTKPVFGAQNVKILRVRKIGKNREYLKLSLDDSKNRVIDALVFNDSARLEAMLIEKYGYDAYNALLIGKTSDITLSFTYYPTINDYMGKQSVEIILSDFKL